MDGVRRRTDAFPLCVAHIATIPKAMETIIRVTVRDTLESGDLATCLKVTYEPDAKTRPTMIRPNNVRNVRRETARRPARAPPIRRHAG